jgi:hypothetical protein
MINMQIMLKNSAIEALQSITEVHEITSSLELEEERNIITSIYLKRGFFHLGVVWIESNQYIKIIDDSDDYIQRYEISKKYNKGYFKLFDI